MTHFAYTLEEASGRLNLSETVLIRLSQYFKMPTSAYETMGGMSFKGDPLFEEEDLAFFREVKDRLLAGETLEALKKRPPTRPSVPAAPVPGERTRFEAAARLSDANAPITIGAALREAERATPPLEASPPPLLAESAPSSRATDELLNIENPHLLSNMAAQSFRHYKNQHRVGLGQVFKKILQGIGLAGTEGGPTAKRHFSAPRHLTTDGKNAINMERSPFVSPPAFQPRVSFLMPSESREKTEKEADVSLPASVQSRILDNRLSQAARRLKERALSQNG